MPPWHIDQSVGVQKFKNDISLSDDQIDTIVRWVDSGAPQGDAKDLPRPKPLTTSNEWQGVRDGFGPPDVVVKSEEYLMPARHQDVWWRSMNEIPITAGRFRRRRVSASRQSPRLARVGVRIVGAVIVAIRRTRSVG